MQVKVAGSEVTPLAFTVEEKKNTPASFDLKPLAPYTGSLGADTTFTRNGTLQLTGLVGKRTRSFGPMGFNQHLSGQDYLRKLATRCVKRELFRNCTPKAIIQFLNRPSRKIGILRYHYFGDGPDYNDFYYELQYDSLWHWNYTSEKYSVYINDDDGWGSFYFPNHILASTYSDDVYIAQAIWRNDFYASMTVPPAGYRIVNRRVGTLLKYKDANNYLVACLRSRIATYAPSQLLIQAWLEIVQMLDGVETTLTTLCVGQVYAAIESEIQRFIQEFNVRIFQNGTALTVELVQASGTIPVTPNAVSAEVNSAFLGEGRLGVYAAILPVEYGGHPLISWGTMEFHKLTLRMQPVATSSVSPGSGSPLDMSDLSEETGFDTNIIQAEGQWSKINLGEIKSISAIKIVQDIARYARNYEIQRSLNDVEWYNVVTVTASSTPTILHSFPPVSGQYWRIILTASAPYYWRINEIYVREADDGANILQEGTIDEYDGLVTFRVDYEPGLGAMYRLADALGWHLWADKDGKLNFKAERGIDKSGSVVFQRGINILSTHREQDVVNPLVAGRILVRGQGLGQQSTVTSPTIENSTLIEKYPEFQDIDRESGGGGAGGGGIDAGTGGGAAESEMEDTSEDWSDDWSQ